MHVKLQGRRLTQGLLVSAAIMLLAAASAWAGGSHESAATSRKTFSGTIHMYAESYSPNQVFTPNQIRPTELATLAKEYTSLHPGVKIDFVQNLASGADYMTWLRTKSAGGELPDIVWVQWQKADTSVPHGVLTNLGPHLGAADPYVPGKTWGETLNKQIVAETRAPDGASYVINGDYVGTATYYNKDMFRKAGITTLPTTWSEFISACQKLKVAGFTPFAWDLAATRTGIDRLSWLTRLFYTNFFMGDWKKLEFTGTDNVNLKDDAIAVHKGIYGMDNPRWMALWPILKDFSQYWQKDFTGSDSNGNGPKLAFIAGKVAMYFDGSWAARQIQSAKPDFQWGTFSNPYPTPTLTKYATTYDSSGSIGGPSSSFQYAIPTQKADNSMSPAKLAATVDWLMYITTAGHDEAIVNQLGEYVPTVNGTHPIPSLAHLGKLISKPLYATFGGYYLNESERSAFFRSFQSYVLGQLTLAQFGEQATQLMNRTADALAQQNHWDFAKY